MTKEMLNEIENDYWEEKADPIDMAEVFDLASKALEQQPCEDCISREAVIRLVEQYPNIIGNRCSGLIADIKHLPSVTPKGVTITDFADKCQECGKILNDKLQTRWIPVSERMPNINIHVLAQFVMGGMAECYYAHNWWHIVGGFRISGDEVIAWMPLPQPYKESDSE